MAAVCSSYGGMEEGAAAHGYRGGQASTLTTGEASEGRGGARTGTRVECAAAARNVRVLGDDDVAGHWGNGANNGCSGRRVDRRPSTGGRWQTFVYIIIVGIHTHTTDPDEDIIYARILST